MMTKKRGTKNTARKVAVVMPATTLWPMDRRPAAPAPTLRARGSAPRIVLMAVMSTGRRRMRAAATAASTMPAPLARICAQNSTMRMAFLADSPIRVIRPIWK